MAILIRPASRMKKKKSKNSQEVLRRLKEYLDENCDEPARILCGFWKDQQNAISYQELRQAVKDGAISQETMKLWQQDYSRLVAGSLATMWTAAVEAGPTGQPLLDGLSFGVVQTPNMINWIQARGAEFVTSVMQEQKDAISALLSKKMRDSHTVDELARMIRPCIGLTEGQAKANAKYYDSIVANLKKEHPRMKKESIQRRARDAAQKYAERQHRQRAMTIAQTESAFAYNRGADEGVRQAQEQGLLGTVKKRWSTSGDGSVCNICASLEGVEIGMGDNFSIKGKVLFVGQHMLPPAHPRCACAVEYIEEDRPLTAVLGAGDIADNPESNMQKLGEIDFEKTDEALNYYNETIRSRDKENVVVIDKEGGVYYSEGSASNVNISGVDLSGALITHNHPASNGIVSFGKDDFEFLKENQSIRRLIAVNEQYTYTVEVLQDISGLAYSDYYRKAMEAADIFDLDFDIQHKVFEILDQEGFLKYVREKLN